MKDTTLNIAHEAAIGFSYAAQAWQEAGSHFTGTAIEWRRPSVVFRPKLYPDGDMYCALYGDDLMAGCAGFGETAAAAMLDFDNNWRTQKVKHVPQRSDDNA